MNRALSSSIAEFTPLKLGWYRTYDVLECWLVDPEHLTVTVVNLQEPEDGAGRSFRGNERVCSPVLPRFDQAASEFFT